MPESALLTHRPSPARIRPPRPVPEQPGSSRVAPEGGGIPTHYDRLRAPGDERPLVDPSLSGGLRAWLEDGVTGIEDRWREPGPLVIRRDGDTEASERAATALVRIVFRLTVAAGPIARPFEAALAACAAGDAGRDVLESVRRMSHTGRSVLRQEVLRHAATIAAQWRQAPASWLPRTVDRLRVPLAGGRVLLAATADLVLGPPPSTRASVSLVRLEDGKPRERHAADRACLALLETLRSGAPPFCVATYYSGSGRLDVDRVTDGMLATAVADSIASVARRASLRAAQ